MDSTRLVSQSLSAAGQAAPFHSDIGAGGVTADPAQLHFEFPWQAALVAEALATATRAGVHVQAGILPSALLAVLRAEQLADENGPRWILSR